MALNPEVQDRAQAELDKCLIPSDAPQGAVPTRLPTFEDRDHLPYISAIVKEVWRWNPSVPLGKLRFKSNLYLTDAAGLPHVATQDDVYRGYTIEKVRIFIPFVQDLHESRRYPPHRAQSCGPTFGAPYPYLAASRIDRPVQGHPP
jgi:hypothetical protein